MDENQILHRDLKPANILLNNKGVLKIIDFGLARHTDVSYLQEQKQQYTKSITSPLYRAPECFLFQKMYSSKVDMWAAGLIFFEIITKQPLLNTENELAVFKSMLTIFGFPNE